MGVRAEPRGQNHHLNPIEARVFEEGMTDLLLMGENRTVRSFKGKRREREKMDLLLSGETSEMIRGVRQRGSVEKRLMRNSYLCS